jgi:dTDP-4-amino-4,6-dideoxygalactose transaminase
MRVPLLDLKLQYQTIKAEAEAAMLKVAETQMLILGEEVKKLETTLAEYCGAQYAVGVSSGTDALLMALMAIDLQPGDQVILPDYSFFATAGVVARMKAIPVFVDSDPVTFNIEPEGIRSKINARTKAIIPVHLYGQAAAMDEIMAIADEYGIPVIEDCAQAIGADASNGKPVGSMGLIGCYSFYPTKNLGAFGDGGLVVTSDQNMYEKLMQIRNHGMEPKYYHKFVGGNFRLDAIQAAVLNVKFPHLEDWNQARRNNAALYSKYFMEQGLADKEGVTEFSADNKVLLPKAVYKRFGLRNCHIFNQYIIRVEKRDELRAFLSANEIGSEIYYPVPFHKQECFAYLNSVDAEFPVSNSAADTSIALPIFPELTEEQIAFVVEKIAEFIKK